MEKKYCKCCKRKINAVPFIGEKYYEFEDGIYCEKCSKVMVHKRREKGLFPKW